MHSKCLFFSFLFCLTLSLSIFSTEERGIAPLFSPLDLDEFLAEEGLPYQIDGMDLIQKDLMPKHIAFIMDGNRRWAKQRHVPEISGHAKGGEALLKLIRFLYHADLGIKTITVYAFSTENWKRSQKEVDFLMDLFAAYIEEMYPYIKKYPIRLETIGDLEKLPQSVQEVIETSKNIPIENAKLTLVLALNYGGRDELKRAFSKMAIDFKNEMFTEEDISEDLIDQYLDTHPFGDPQLVIRTGKEKRISNFLLWQSAYAEFHFSQSYWPDFSDKELVEILLDYQSRDRRFGGNSNEPGINSAASTQPKIPAFNSNE